MAISFISNALGGTTTTTSFSITLPATQSGDIFILEFAHRGTGNGTIGGTSGLSWTLKHSQLFASSAFSGKTYWARATGNHSGQTVTGSGLTDSCAAIVTVYRGALASGDPLAAATVVGEQNASANETQAGITTTVANAWVVLVVVNSPDLNVSSGACTSPGVLTERAERLSTGGTDASVSHWSELKTGTGGTGAFTWAQTNAASGSWAYAIQPAILSSISPSISPSVSLSPSISPSVSESPSLSPSVSISPSVSESPSISPSISASPSVSPSVSESPSISPSVSTSPSISPSVSESPSVSPSVSAPPVYDGAITFVIIHNKGAQGNFDQIETLKTKLTEVIENTAEESQIIHYEFIGLSVNYEVKISQIFPYGVLPPSNFNDLQGRAVFYGTGDEDKTGTHPRFFNWGFKRGLENGDDFVYVISNVNNLSALTISTQITAFIQNPLNVLAENTAGQMLTPSVINTGLLDENMDFTTALQDLITRLNNQGFTTGGES